MAWRAGAREVTVVARDEEAARRWTASEAGLPVPVRVLRDEDPLPPLDPSGELLVLSALVLPQADLLERLLESSREAGRSIAAAASSSPAPGPAVITGKELRAPAAGASLGSWSRSVIRSPACGRLAAGEGACRRLDTPGALQEADRAMYVGLTSATDGYIDRVFNRRVSGWFTRRIINLPVTPNGVTWLHFSLGLLAAWLLWHSDYRQQCLGALLFQLSVALDCSDGEIARLKYQFSKFGSWLDVWADNAVNAAVFLAAARSSAVQLGPQLATTLGLLAVAGVGISISVVYTMARLQSLRRPAEASTLAVTNRLSSRNQAAPSGKRSLVDGVINEATSRDFSVLVVACALTGHLEWFAWLAGIGSHLFWVTFTVIQLSMLRTVNAESR
jgi:phosphatidylglycerophosphate synthase